MFKYIVLILFFLNLLFNTFSQNLCNLPKRTETFGTPFGVSQQSKSTTMQPGQKARYNIVVYKNFAYRISLHANKSLDGLYFRILSDNQASNMIFDSSVLNAKKQEKVLYVNNSNNLIIEVIFPEQKLETIHNKKNNEACIGVLIEYYKKDMVEY